MRKTSAFILIFSLCILLCSCRTHSDNNVHKYTQTEFALGTIVTLTVYDEDESSLQGAFELCKHYESLLSSNIEGSDVWKINHAEGKTVTVSDETAELINLSLKYSVMTDGAFDITIAPISALWNFSGESPAVPSDESIQKLLHSVDYTRIEINGNEVTIPAGSSIELGAVAKGYISDKLSSYFTAANVTGAVINLGGNVATVGTRPDGSLWQIGIRDPLGSESDSIGILSVSETSIVTSGIYERCFEEDGNLYHHILDPKTGYPAANDLASVTIICKNGAAADALSTSLFLMDFEKALSFAEGSNDIEAVFILKNGAIHKTSGVPMESA